MDEPCPLTEELLEGHPDDSDPGFARHLSRCPECRRRGRVETRLREAFRGVARPSLSPHFPRQLRHRLHEERRRLAATRRRRRWMQLYWLAASLASAGAVSLAPWPAEVLSGASGATLLLALTSVAAPVVLLLRACRADLVELILGTVDQLEVHREG